MGCGCVRCLEKRLEDRIGINLTETIVSHDQQQKVVDLIEWKKKKGLLNG